MATSLLPSRGPKRGRKCYVTRILGGPLQRGTKSELAASPAGVGIRNSTKSYPAGSFPCGRSPRREWLPTTTPTGLSPPVDAIPGGTGPYMGSMEAEHRHNYVCTAGESDS